MKEYSIQKEDDSDEQLRYLTLPNNTLEIVKRRNENAKKRILKECNRLVEEGRDSIRISRADLYFDNEIVNDLNRSGNFIIRMNRLSLTILLNDDSDNSLFSLSSPSSSSSSSSSCKYCSKYPLLTETIITVKDESVVK